MRTRTNTPPPHASQILVGTNILPELFEKPAPSLLFIHDLQRCQRCRRVHPVFEDAARILKVRPRQVEVLPCGHGPRCLTITTAALTGGQEPGRSDCGPFRWQRERSAFPGPGVPDLPHHLLHFTRQLW